MDHHKPHIVLVIARGEAVRNFLYSDTLKILKEKAKVTILSRIDHGEVIDFIKPHVDQVTLLKEYRESSFVTNFRYMIHTAHYRWLWSDNARHMWALHDSRATTWIKKFQRFLFKFLAILFANRNSLQILTRIENYLSWKLRLTRDFDKIFSDLQPDLVFNCSHIHGPEADLPLRIAQRMGIPTAAFIFSWDNLTTRSRIFVPYDYYLMWNDSMKNLLVQQYPNIKPKQIFVTGTPQFDFHFKPEYCLSREELCNRIGIDPARPYVLYTTGMDTDFLDEHKFIQAIIGYLQTADLNPRPQLVVRTYIKGTNPEILNLAKRNIPDVIFPPILWDKQWIMPLREDLTIYTSLLHHCALGINAASTVTLELMALDKPVINLGMEPPGSNLPDFERFSRHVDYEHYRPVAKSGGVMVAKSVGELFKMINFGLSFPDADSEKRKNFMSQMMNGTLDGGSGRRVAEQLIMLAKHGMPAHF